MSHGTGVEARFNPLRRVSPPEDVADVIVFFVSEQTRWVTGQLLYHVGRWSLSYTAVAEHS